MVHLLQYGALDDSFASKIRGHAYITIITLATILDSHWVATFAVNFPAKGRCTTHGILRSWSHEIVMARMVSIVLTTPNTIVPTGSLSLFADARWVPFVRDVMFEMKAIFARVVRCNSL